MRNKVLTALISLLIALGMWLFVINYVSPGWEETVYNIPVVFEGVSALEQRGLMITSDVSDITVDLTLSGNRSDLVKLDSDNIILKADLSGIYDPGPEKIVYYTKHYPGDVPSNAISVVSSSTNHVTVSVERRVSKPVPVRVDYVGAVPDGFIVDKENAVLDHTEVNVTGPSSAVDQIKRAIIEVDLQNQSESISKNYRYTLCDAKNEPVDAQMVKVDAEEVHLDMKIQRFIETRLVYTLTEGGGATAETTEIVLSPGDTIQLAGNPALLEGLEEINLGTIDLGAIAEDTVLTFPIKLPEGVENLSGVEEIQAAVSFPGLATKQFSVSDFQMLNVPENLQVDLLTKQVTVTMRGAQRVLDTLKEDDLIVVLDFANAEPGAAKYKATVAVSDSFSQVGAVGSYTVPVNVSEKK